MRFKNITISILVTFASMNSIVFAQTLDSTKVLDTTVRELNMEIAKTCSMKKSGNDTYAFFIKPDIRVRISNKSRCYKTIQVDGCQSPNNFFKNKDIVGKILVHIQNECAQTLGAMVPPEKRSKGFGNFLPEATNCDVNEFTASIAKTELDIECEYDYLFHWSAQEELAKKLRTQAMLDAKIAAKKKYFSELLPRMENLLLRRYYRCAKDASFFRRITSLRDDNDCVLDRLPAILSEFDNFYGRRTDFTPAGLEYWKKINQIAEKKISECLDIVDSCEKSLNLAPPAENDKETSSVRAQ